MGQRALDRNGNDNQKIFSDLEPDCGRGGNGGEAGHAEEKREHLAEMTSGHHRVHLDGVNYAGGERVWS
jgi:hypothetical protein